MAAAVSDKKVHTGYAASEKKEVPGIPGQSSFFDLENGKISPRFQALLKIIGITARAGIADAAEDLDPFFYPNLGHFKGGGKAKVDLEITEEQASDFLDALDKMHKDDAVMPNKKRIDNAILPCGVEATNAKRFNSLKVAIEEKGCKFKQLQIIAKNSEEEKSVRAFIQKNYKDLLENTTINTIVAHKELNGIEEGLSLLAPKLEGSYAIITDPGFDKFLILAKQAFQNNKCLGMASVPMPSKTAIELFGYEGVIPFVKDELNVLARKVNVVAKTIKSSKSMES